jgi:hypothetical protein
MRYWWVYAIVIGASLFLIGKAVLAVMTGKARSFSYFKTIDRAADAEAFWRQVAGDAGLACLFLGGLIWSALTGHALH